MKKFLFIPLAIIFIAGICLSGCGEKMPEPGSVLRVSMPTFAYESFDPIDGESFFGWSMYDPIITWDENGDFVGAIAESWDISDDGLTWTFHIRQGVTFHNGDPLTSADVMFSVQHMQDPASWNPWSPYLSYNFDTMYCPDDYTFVYQTLTPEIPLMICFGATRVLPQNYIEENGWDYFDEHPIGSGPWIFQEFVSGDHITMTANLDHWRTVPDFETLIQYVVPEESTQVAMLERGDVDIITGISLDRALELGDEGWGLRQAGTPTGVMLCFPGTFFVESGPMYYMEFRDALAYAIDYEELCATFFHGFAEPGGQWFMWPNSWGWGDDWEPETYDLAMAQSLLDSINYPDAFDDPVVDIWVQFGTAYTDDLMLILQGYWAAAGIQTEIHIVDPFEWAGMFFVPHYDDPTLPNVGAIFPWVYPDAWANNVYHSFNMYCGGVHTCGQDPQANALYDAAVHNPDPDACEAAWTTFMEYAIGMRVTLGVVLVWDQMVVNDDVVGDFGWGNWITIADAYADIEAR
jgi:peptide/nickel transport system substrate-binding protein